MKKVMIVSDFDGTITRKDSLVEILDRFASPKWRDLARLITEGRMGTRIGLRKEFSLCKITRKEFVDFLKRDIDIDRSFKKFLEFCEKNDFKLVVVSGGFKLNIDIIFAKAGIKNVHYYANIITFQGSSVKLKFPYRDKICKDCSLCKAPFIKRFKREGYFTIYIGDSVTDRCPAKVADLVFAKHHLAQYCKAKGISYIPYDTFGQIRSYLQSLVIARRPKADEAISSGDCFAR